MKKKLKVLFLYFPLLVIGGFMIGFCSVWVAELISHNVNNEGIVTTNDYEDSNPSSYSEAQIQVPPSVEVGTMDTSTFGNMDSMVSSDTVENVQGFGIYRIEGPKVNTESKTYELKVQLHPKEQARINTSDNPYIFELYTPNQTTPEYVTRNGEFTGITPKARTERQPSYYKLVVTNIQTGEKLEQEIDGFKPIYSKLTCAQLTRNFNNQGPASSIHEADSIRLKFRNCKDAQLPSTLYDIYTRLAANWTKVDVLDVQYNERNQIIDITIRVTQ